MNWIRVREKMRKGKVASQVESRTWNKIKTQKKRRAQIQVKMMRKNTKRNKTKTASKLTMNREMVKTVKIKRRSK